VLGLKERLLWIERRFEESLFVCNEQARLCETASPIPRPEWLNEIALDRAEVLCSLNRYDEALCELDKVRLREHSRSETACLLSTRARVYLKLKDLSKALEDARKATEAKPGMPNVLTTYGLILTRTGKLDEAEWMLNEAISIDCFFAEAYWFRHELYEKLDRVDDSNKDRATAEGYAYKPYM
jgi:predicted Zn-dependent protease